MGASTNIREVIDAQSERIAEQAARIAELEAANARLVEGVRELAELMRCSPEPPEYLTTAGSYADCADELTALAAKYQSAAD